MISKIPNVFKISKSMNQTFDPARPAFHNATPFQIIDQTITSPSNAIDPPGIFTICSNPNMSYIVSPPTLVSYMAELYVW